MINNNGRPSSSSSSSTPTSVPLVGRDGVEVGREVGTGVSGRIVEESSVTTVVKSSDTVVVTSIMTVSVSLLGSGGSGGRIGGRTVPDVIVTNGSVVEFVT